MSKSKKKEDTRLDYIFKKAEGLIKKGYYDEPMVELRKIAHYMLKWEVYNEKLWDEAREKNDGGQWGEPPFFQCINSLRKHNKINTETRHMFEGIKDDGNVGAHDVGNTRADAEYNYKNLYTYYVGFKAKFPYADRLSRKPGWKENQNRKNANGRTKPKNNRGQSSQQKNTNDYSGKRAADNYDYGEEASFSNKKGSIKAVIGISVVIILFVILVCVWIFSQTNKVATEDINFEPTDATVSISEAWGPQDRQMFTWDNPSGFATFNSITDNPSLGHESNFVRIREADVGATYGDDVTLEIGKEYEVFIYYHNNGASSNEADVMADNVRVKSNFPTKLEDSQTGEIKGTITATNTDPVAVWDSAYIHTDSTVYLSYVPNSAVLHNDSNGESATDGTILDSESLFGDGAKIAYDSRAWGFIPGGNKYAGYVTYRIKVDQPGWITTSTVSAEGTNSYSENINVKPGDTLDFKIEYHNNGTTWQTNVTVHDTMPKGLEYIEGSSYVSNEKKENQKVSDILFSEKGLNIGDYNSGQWAVIEYKARVSSDLSLFVDGETTLYNDVRLVTENGTQYDKVKITVLK